MSETLLEEVFRNMFDTPEPKPVKRDHGYGLEGYRERINMRQTTSPEERAFDERRDLEDTFGIYEDPCTAFVHIRR